MFKRRDYILFIAICLLLGIFIVSQYSAMKEYKKVTLPENTEVLAVEVSRLTKNNSDLRQEVKKLTSDLDSYKSTSESRAKTYDQYLSDTERFDLINGIISKNGQGITITIVGKASAAQIIDLVNAIKNIGSDLIAIDNQRIQINTDLSRFAGLDSIEVSVLGNSNLLKSAVERKGGIIEQISTKDVKINVESKDVSIPSSVVSDFHYAKIISN